MKTVEGHQPSPGLLTAALQWPWADNAHDAPPATRLLRAGLRILLIFFREFWRDAIPLRASALTFTVVLALVPTLALGTAVLKGLGSGDQLRKAVYGFLDQFDSGTMDQGGVLASPASGASAGDMDAGRQMSGHLRRATDQIFASVDRTNFSALGAFGIIGLLVAVLSVLGSIETAMNSIWQADKSRPFGRRLMDYLACMILLPLSINLAFATGAMVQNQSLLSLIDRMVPIVWRSYPLLKVLPSLLLISTFTMLYRFLPNTRVRFWPALFGGLVGGGSWLVVQTLYVSMQIGVARYNTIYGSFATIPLFLLWLYLAWIVFLCGAEAAFAVQVWRVYAWHRQEAPPVKRLSLAFQVLETMAMEHRARRVSSPDSLMAAMPDHRQADIAAVLLMLAKGGLIQRVAAGEGYLLSAPLADITAAEIVTLVCGHPSAHTHPLARAALQAATRHLASRPLSAPADAAQPP